MNIGDSIIDQADGSPAAMTNGRKATFSNRSRLFKNRCLSVVPEERFLPVKIFLFG